MEEHSLLFVTHYYYFRRTDCTFCWTIRLVIVVVIRILYKMFKFGNWRMDNPTPKFAKLSYIHIIYFFFWSFQNTNRKYYDLSKCDENFSKKIKLRYRITCLISVDKRYAIRSCNPYSLLICSMDSINEFQNYIFSASGASFQL